MINVSHASGVSLIAPWEAFKPFTDTIKFPEGFTLK
jgi:hypothetical protein